MKEEKQGGGFDSTVLPQKAEHFALPDSKPVMPARLDGKRKPKAKKTDSSSEDNCFIGQSICGVVDGLFDAGYMLTVRVGDTDTILRGIVFEPGLSVPISEANDIAPNVKVIKRDESILFPEAPNTSNSMPVRQHSHVPILPSPVPHAIQMSSSRTQKQIGSGPTDMECYQLDSSPFKSTSISEAVSRFPLSMPTSNAPAKSSVGVQNQMEPPERIYGKKDMVAHQAITGPLTTSFTSQDATGFPSPLPVPDALCMTSRHVQNQVGVPGHTEMVYPRPDAIPSKSSSISQSQSVPMVCFPIPVSNTPGTSSVHVQDQMRYPFATVGSGKADTVTPQPDGVPSKSTPISVEVSMLPSPVPLESTLGTSSVHVQDQIRHPYATVGSVKTDTVPPHPYAVPSKSTSNPDDVSRLPSLVPLPNALANSSVHVQNQMRYPYANVVSGKTDVPHQVDGVPSKCISISEAVSRLPSSAPLANSLATSPVHVQMEAGPSFIAGSTRTDMVPQLDSNPSKSTFISQTLQLLPSSMPALNNVANSIVHVHNEMGPPATDCSGQKVTMPVPNALGMPSVHLQNQAGPLMTGSGQIDMVAPISDANPLKSISISQTSSILPSSMPLSNNALATSTFHAQNEMEPPATFGSSQNDMLSVPDALGMSSVHLQKQTGLPLKIGSSQINTLLLQPDLIPSKSTSIFQAVTISPSSMAAPNTLAISSAHVQTPMGPPATIGSGQKDVMPQQDAIPHKSTSVLQTVPIVSSAVSVPIAPASQSFFVQNIEPPVRIGSGQTDLKPSQPDVMPLNSTSISQTVPMLSVPVPVPTAPSSAFVLIKNQVEAPVKIALRDTDSVPSQPAAISQSPAIEPGQIDMVATQPEEIQCLFPSISQSLPMLQASIPITFTAVTSSEPSTNSEPEPDSHPSGHDFHSTEATETRMDVDEGA